MDLVFTRVALLDEGLDAEVLGAAFERVWREELRVLAKLRLERLGITDRDAFVLDADASRHEHLSEVLLMLSSMVPGRTTTDGYARAALRFARWLGHMKLGLDSGGASVFAAYHRYKRHRRGVTARTWNAEAAALKTFLKAAARAKIIAANPLVEDDTGWYDNGAGAKGDGPEFLTMRQFIRFRDRGLASARYALRNVAFGNYMLSPGMRLDEGNDYRKAWLPTLEDLAKAETRTLPQRVRASSAKGGKGRKVRISVRVGRVHLGPQRAASGVHRHLALAAGELLAAVVAARPADFRRAHGPAVDDRRRGPASPADGPAAPEAAG